MKLDPQNSDYTQSVGGALELHGDFGEADRLYLRAGSILGTYMGNWYYNRVLMRLQWRGPEAALRLWDRTPANQGQPEFLHAELLLAEGKNDEGRAAAQREDVPTRVMGFGGFTNAAGSNLLALGLRDRARAWAEIASAEATKQFSRGNRSPLARRNFVGAEIVLGHRDSALAELGEWRAESQRVPSVLRRMIEFNLPAAALYARLGVADEAVALLREVAANRYLTEGFALRYRPDYALVRNDPRFQELMKQQEAWATAQPDPADL